MAVDLKLDIIYYNTPTDFEMEFSLSSRCVMRMLTSKSEGAKNFLNDLSRAVSRSRVIMCVGDIYDKSGIVSITAQAVGLKLCSYDADAYNVKDDTSRNVLLPDGALPLVSEDGTLGGCLIESGPQIIIFLSDSKPLRKRILKELVFEYITALSGANANTKAHTEQEKIANAAQENAESDNSTIVTAEQEEEPEQESKAEPELNTQVQPDNDTSASNIVSASDDNGQKVESDAEYTISDDLSEEIDRDFEANIKPRRKGSKFLGLKITIGVLCGILAAITGALIYYYIG